LCQLQEDMDQLEGFKTQEMSKIKHLLLQKEQLLSEKDKQIHEHSQKINELSNQVRTLLEQNCKLSDAEVSGIHRLNRAERYSLLN